MSIEQLSEEWINEIKDLEKDSIIKIFSQIVREISYEITQIKNINCELLQSLKNSLSILEQAYYYQRKPENIIEYIKVLIEKTENINSIYQ